MIAWLLAMMLAQDFGSGTPVQWTTSQATTTTAGGTTTTLLYPTDWSSSIAAIWDMEESAGSAEPDDGTTGEDDASDSGTAGRNTSTYREGAQSIAVGGAIAGGPDYLTCAHSTCTGINMTAGNSFTVGGWVYMTNATNSSMYFYQKYTSTTNGFQFFFRPITSGGGDLRCQLQLSTDLVDDHGTNNTTGEWYHAVCVVLDEDGASEGTNTLNVEVYRNAATDGGNGGGDINGPEPSADTNIGDGSNFDGLMDEFFYDDTDWAADEIARACSIGIRGTLGVCDSGTPANYKPCDSNSDCGASGVCDTGATDTYCSPGASAGCCMGHNSDYCSDAQMTACNASAP